MVLRARTAAPHCPGPVLPADRLRLQALRQLRTGLPWLVPRPGRAAPAPQGVQGGTLACPVRVPRGLRRLSKAQAAVLGQCTERQAAQLPPLHLLVENMIGRAIQCGTVPWQRHRSSQVLHALMAWSDTESCGTGKRQMAKRTPHLRP